MSHKSEYEGKSDRALALKEQGLSRAEIAERLSVKPGSVAGMVQRARQRRDRGRFGVSA